MHWVLEFSPKDLSISTLIYCEHINKSITYHKNTICRCSVGSRVVGHKNLNDTYSTNMQLNKKIQSNHKMSHGMISKTRFYFCQLGSSRVSR